MQRRPVTFFSDGDTCAADLYLPDNLPSGARIPAVVRCNGFAASRGLVRADTYANLVDAGFACFAFDYRGWGESGGERGRIDPLQQVEDVRNAVTFLASQDNIAADRIGALGVSFGALVVVQAAAADPRIAAVHAAIGVANGREAMRNIRTPAEMEQWDKNVLEARERRVLFNETSRSLTNLDVFKDVDSIRMLGALASAHPETQTAFGFDSIGRVFDFRPIDVIDRIAPRPVAFACAQNDITGDPASFRKLFDRAHEPKQWSEYPCGHFDFYIPGPTREAYFAEVIRFFQRYL